MSNHKLHISMTPKLDGGRMLIGFSGWMNSGEVSTGTANWLIAYLDARKFAEIEPEGFYIYNFPGPMEMTAMFRPHTKIAQGQIVNYQTPQNIFYFDRRNNLVIFEGKEPNLDWQGFAELVFALCSQVGIREIYFVGSVAGLMPHTREPRVFCSVSEESIKNSLSDFGVKFTDYEGPASFITHLTMESAKRNISMTNLVATVPAYVQGENIKCIEAMLKNLKVILKLDIELDALRDLADEYEKRLTGAIAEMPELQETIEKLEEDYDKEIFELQMTDLQDWLHQKGIRLD